MRHTKEGVIEKLLASIRPYDVIDESLLDTLLSGYAAGDFCVQLAKRGLRCQLGLEGHPIKPIDSGKARDSNVLRGGGMWAFECYGMTPAGQEAIYTHNQTEPLLLAALEVP